MGFESVCFSPYVTRWELDFEFQLFKVTGYEKVYILGQDRLQELNTVICLH